MPNRLLREGVCTSELINMLSPEEEVMFYRLLVVCDDYGYADARPAILKAQCFPLKETVKPADIERWLSALSGRSLCLRYRKGDKPYVAVAWVRVRVRVRGQRREQAASCCLSLRIGFLLAKQLKALAGSSG
jgi:hypothetical protein